MRNNILTLFFALLSIQLNAFNEEIYSRLIGSEIATNANLKISDQDYPGFNSIKYIKSGVQVRLFFDESIPKNYSNNFRVSLEYELKLFGKGSSSPTLLAYPLTHTIELDYFNAGVLNDLSHEYHSVNIKDVRYAELKVKKITSQFIDINGAPLGSPTILTDLGAGLYNSIKLELKYSAEKYKPLASGSIVYGHSVKNLSGVVSDMPAFIHHPGSSSVPTGSKESGGNEVLFYWRPIIGAEWYDLEWVFIDAGNDNISSTNYAINWKNATRIQTTGNFYQAPLLYPKGKIAYRIRAVGVDTSSTYFPRELAYTAWSSLATNTSQGNCVFGYSGLNDNLNWTSTTSYAEEGKQKSVLSIFDPFGKQRQMLTSLSTDSLLVVSENLYDHMGRASVQLLPMVEEFKGLYFTGVRNTSFLKEDFDIDSQYAGLGNPLLSSPPMSGNSISDFYSSDNEFMSYSGGHFPKIMRKTMASYIADAQGYAYQQTRFSNDGSGRPHSQSLPGGTHHLGSGHETKYYYGTPGSQAEIDRLFGNEAGFVAHYKKEMVIDANGQVSVSYKDGYDRVIATALAGNGTPDLLHSLPSAGGFPTIESSAIGNNHITPSQELEASKVILIPAPGTPLEIEYLADTAMFRDICLGDVPCKFEVSISLVDEEGGHLLDFNSNNGLMDEPSYLSFNGSSGFSYSHTIPSLEIGKYTLVKRVRVSNIQSDSSIISHLNNVIGTDTSTAGNCFVPPVYDSPCISCEAKCEETFRYNYEYLGLNYIIYRVNDTSYVGLTTDSTIAEIVDISGTKLFRLIDQNYADSLEAFVLACKEICNTTPTFNTNTECDVLLAVLKSDLSPGGQYFDNRPQNPNYFNSGATDYFDPLNMSSTSMNYWLYVYADNSSYSSSFLNDFGSLIGLASLSWPLVRNRWDDISMHPSFDSLMNEFVKIHPEYCIWQAKCELRNRTCGCSSKSGFYLYGNVGGYEDAMYSTNADIEARDKHLFLPLGTILTGPESIFNPPMVVLDSCFGDPLLADECFDAYNFELVHSKLFKFQLDNGTYFSIYDIMLDTNYRWIDTSTYAGPRSLAFVQYMKTLHGDGLNPGMLPAYFGAPLLPNQISYYAFFRGNYDFWRMHLKDTLIKEEFSVCNPEHHLLSEVIANAASLPSPLDEYLNHIPYLSMLDTNEDGKMDVDLQALGLNPSYYVSPIGFEVRMPYYDLPDLNNLTQMASDFCEDLKNSLPNQWISKLENTITGCKRLVVDYPGPIYSTYSDTIITSDKLILESYFVQIVTEACAAYMDSITVGVVGSSNFGIGTSPTTTFSSFPWGAPSANSVDAVIELYQSQYADIIGCPTNFAQIALTDTASQINMQNLECNCNQLANLIGSSGSVSSSYTSVYPYIFNQVPGITQLSDFIDLTAFAEFVNVEGEDLLAPYTNVSTDILEHWIMSCTNKSFSQDSMLEAGGVFPDLFNCTIPQIVFDSCETEYAAYYKMLKFDAFEEYKNNEWQRFENIYESNCLGRLLNNGGEVLNVGYVLKEHHYTLYYYDRAGNLVKTVPPEGVKPIDHIDTLNNIAQFRNIHSYKENYTKLYDSNFGKFRRPNHNKITYYQYDSKNQVIRQKTPDGGESFMYYDFLGRMAISQNEKQRLSSPAKASYTLYDDIGRIKEVGEWTIDLANLDTSKEIRTFIEDLPVNGSIPYVNKLDSFGFIGQITRTYYDSKIIHTEFGMNDSFVEQNNLRNRVSTVAFYEEKPSEWKYYDNAIHYSYDIHGNVKSLVQDVPILKGFGKQFLKTEYVYDLISGNVNSVHYMPNQKEGYAHYYMYDADNRITRVYSSMNSGLTKELDAKYYYHLLGPLARIELGKHQVQGIDYSYNLQGWIKGVNSDKINPRNDRGQDGYNQLNNIHRNFGTDAMGYSLGYYSGDYVSIDSLGTYFKSFELTALGVDSAEKWMNVNNTAGLGYGLYNGNIVKMVSNTLDCDENPMDVLGRFYQYDQLNRIKQSKAATINNAGMYNAVNSETWSVATYGNRFRTNFNYDADGNILNLKRYSGSASLMDNISYNYSTVNNRLMAINDPVVTAGIMTDIEGYSSYNYDAIGNLISDSQNDNSTIDWTVYGKVKRVDFVNKADLWFGYNPMGNRIMKRVIDSLNNKERLQIYALDAQGNTLAIYEVNSSDAGYKLDCKERILYGSSRLGMSKKVINLGTQTATSFPMRQIENSIYELFNPQYAVANAAYVPVGMEKVLSGQKDYELNNHLGNVLSTISDRKLVRSGGDATVNYYVPDVRSATEYYPFGSMLEGWGCAQSTDCIQTNYSYIDTLVKDHYNIGLVGDLVTPPYYDYDPIGTVSYYTMIGGNKVLVYNATALHQPIMRHIFGEEHGKTYTVKFRARVTSGSAQVTVRRYNRANPSLYGNATSSVVNLNGTWNTHSISFVADSAWRYTVHFRNSNSGNTSMQIDSIQVYGEKTANYLSCTGDSVGYRFGFNGQEKDNEVTGIEGSHNTAEYWMYDTRLGRRWNVDPYAQISLSDYSCFKNNPLFFIDIKGSYIDPNDRESQSNFDNHKSNVQNRINQLNTSLETYLKDPLKNASEITYAKEAISQLNATLSEMDALYNNPKYRLVITEYLGNGKENGQTVLNDNNIIEIKYKAGQGDVLNHELLHGFQYLTGDLVIGGFASDIGDEILAKKRGFAFSREHDVGGATSFSEINYNSIYPMYKGTVSTLPLNANSKLSVVMISHIGNSEIRANLELLNNQLMRITLSYGVIAQEYYNKGNKEQYDKVIQQMKNAQEAFLNSQIGEVLGR